MLFDQRIICANASRQIHDFPFMRRTDFLPPHPRIVTWNNMFETKENYDAASLNYSLQAALWKEYASSREVS
jgi:hypothetical protein